MTQASIIKKYLCQCNNWVPSYDLIKISTDWGWIGSNGDRTARKLAEEGIVERINGGEIGRDKRFVYFRLKERSQEKLI